MQSVSQRQSAGVANLKLNLIIGANLICLPVVLARSELEPLLQKNRNLTTAVSGKAAAWRVMMPSLRKSATLQQTDIWNPSRGTGITGTGYLVRTGSEAVRTGTYSVQTGTGNLY